MKLAVLLTTYNHASYIAQSLESALSQKTTFPFQIIVGDDGSTDGTRELVLQYADKYPNKVIPSFEKTRTGGPPMFRRLYRETSHFEYIAILDGDDYWTDEHKLEKQISFLDQNPDYVAFGHRLRTRREDDLGNSTLIPTNLKETLTLADFMDSCFLPASSSVFRRKLIAEVPQWDPVLKIGDWPLHILRAQFGKTRLSPEIMGVYRMHAQSYWSRLAESLRLQDHLKMYRALRRELQKENIPLIYGPETSTRMEYAIACAEAGEKWQATRAVLQLNWDKISRLRVPPMQRLTFMMRVFAPFAHTFFKATKKLLKSPKAKA